MDLDSTPSLSHCTSLWTIFTRATSFFKHLDTLGAPEALAESAAPPGEAQGAACGESPTSWRTRSGLSGVSRTHMKRPESVLHGIGKRCWGAMAPLGLMLIGASYLYYQYWGYLPPTPLAEDQP